MLSVVLLGAIFELFNVKTCECQGMVELEGYRQTLVVNENAGSVEVCVILLGSGMGDSVIVRVRSLRTGNAEAYVDYVPVNVELTVASWLPRACTNVTILANGIVTGRIGRTFSIQSLILSSSTGVSANFQPLNIEIQDNDKPFIGQVYSPIRTNEGAGRAKMCTGLIIGQLEEGLTLVIDQQLESKAYPNSIVPIPQAFTITQSVNYSCINLTLVDDGLIEDDEVFRVTLKERFDIPISYLNPYDELVFEDDDVAIIRIIGSLNRQVSETEYGSSTTERICIEPVNLKSGLARNITVEVTLSADTAKSGTDYIEKVSYVVIAANAIIGAPPQPESCVDITIIGDDLKEGTEIFYAIFTPVNRDLFLDGQNYVKISIVDQDQNDCVRLLAPQNGTVTTNSFIIRSVAMYRCIPNFRIVPTNSEQRICGTNGWSGSVPACYPECNSHTLQNGMIKFMNLTPVEPSSSETFISEGATAAYQCNLGYFLVGNISRICLSIGLWSGDLPSCQAEDCGNLGPPTNGEVNISGTTFGSEAIYTCSVQYMLSTTVNESYTRNCSANGTWSGTKPICSKAAEHKLDSFVFVVIIYVAIVFN